MKPGFLNSAKLLQVACSPEALEELIVQLSAGWVMDCLQGQLWLPEMQYARIVTGGAGLFLHATRPVGEQFACLRIIVRASPIFVCTADAFFFIDPDGQAPLHTMKSTSALACDTNDTQTLAFFLQRIPPMLHPV